MHEKCDDQQARDPSQTHVEDYFPVLASSTDSRVALEDLTSYRLQIIDTKTRKHASLPPAEDTLPSQLQLMLYHRLLSRLVSSEPSFDFLTFWQLANVDPTRQFSWQFLEEAGLISAYDEFQVLNLADLSALWQDLVCQLRIARVDDQLKLVYRLQSYGPKGESSSVLPAKIIVSSLGTSSNPPMKGAASDENGKLPLVQGWNPLSRSSPRSEQVSSDHKDNPKQHPQELGDIEKGSYQTLGIKTFEYDPGLLSGHVADVLSWWRGERKPRGVPVELTRRCRYVLTCLMTDNAAKGPGTAPVNIMTTVSGGRNERKSFVGRESSRSPCLSVNNPCVHPVVLFLGHILETRLLRSYYH